MSVQRMVTRCALVAMCAGLIFPAQALRAAPAHAAVTLTIATVDNPQMLDMEGVTSDFTKKYGINVKYVTLTENDVRAKVTTDVATGGGQFDLATVGTYEVPIWAKKNWVVNLDPYFSGLSAAAAAAYDKSDLLPKVRLGLSYNGHLYALPFYGESSFTMYNKSIFKAAGLTMPLHPTWDQIAVFAKKLSNPGKGTAGIVLRGTPGWGEMGAPLTTVINTFGGSWFDMSWKPQLTTSPTKDAIAFYLNLLKSYGEPGAANAGFTESERAFSQGKGAMWVDATSAAGLVTDASQSKVASQVGFAFSPTKATPKGSHWLWAWSLAMESSGKHKAEAFKFLQWATSKDYIKLIAAKKGWGNVPPGTRLSTFNNPSYQQAAPYWKIILDSMNTADPTNATLHKVPYVGVQFVGIPEFQQIGDRVTQNLSGVLSGGTTVDAALTLSQNQVTRIMTQSGYLK
ncbi:MAG: extracellular solute-binding protein family 1 [Chloroflexi bacterium]|jgi:sorbitol/mannitol transport system substrate-binding protein|nr:extracellular solute-binding protein family 1 [Chloroflexota bacterium]